LIETNLDSLFTDGHAVDGFTSFYTHKDVENIENIIDRKAINSIYWNNEDDLDLKRRKEAEFLVINDIPINAIIGWVVFDEETKEILCNLSIKANSIKVRKNYYF
jgi:hypothetical protein